MNIVIAKLLVYSFEQTGWNFGALTPQEQDIVGYPSVLEEIHRMVEEEFYAAEEDMEAFDLWLHETR